MGKESRFVIRISMRLSKRLRNLVTNFLLRAVALSSSELCLAMPGEKVLRDSILLHEVHGSRFYDHILLIQMCIVSNDETDRSLTSLQEKTLPEFLVRTMLTEESRASPLRCMERHGTICSQKTPNS